MKTLKSLLAGFLFLGVVTTNAADIVDTAIKAGKFNTLVAAVKAAGLVKTLKGDGPFTVFAPTDAAFSKLPKGTLESLLKPENKGKLANILTYHVVPGKVPSKAVSTSKVKMVNGQNANLKVANGKVTINGANVVAVDIMASNGVIHVIDSVILPPNKSDIVDTAIKAGKFNTLVAAVKAAGLVKTLKGDGPFTVFAPTDAAFAKLPKGTLESLLKPENKGKLANILTYHVVAGKVPSKAVSTSKVKMVNGQNANLKVANGKVTINSANVVAVDVMASNGVIHVIDSVILPPKK
jgi:transforming growth factor-beta-induced protein